VITILLLAVLLVLVLAIATSAVYFLVVLPSRWHLPYELSLPLLNSDDRDDLEQADRLLGQALNAGPRGRALGKIRFAQAYARAMLGTYDKERYSAAAAVLDELITAGGRTEHTSYLEFWVQARLENHLRVADLYAEHSAQLVRYPDSRRIAAASHLHLAAGNWRRREINGALHHFDQVREIGELTDKIPPEANNLQLAKGVQSVFDERLDEAREAFGAARKRSAARELPTLEADLGLLVCDWEDEDPRQLGKRLEQLAEQAQQRPDEDDTKGPLRTGIALLTVIALLREWLDKPDQSGAPSAADFEELARRVAATHDADPDLGDPFLIDGLVHYYFALNQPEREQALATLDDGTQRARAIALPEVRRLMERERELGGKGDAISRYLELVAEFLADPERSEQERQRLRNLREKVIQSADPNALPPDGPMPDQRAQAEDHQRRVKELVRRVELIVYQRIRDLPDDHPAREVLRNLRAELDRAGHVYADGAQVLRSAEQGLMVSVGEFLLPEESG
jgi:thioredoxin-like negative regulator of GroEL